MTETITVQDDSLNYENGGVVLTLLKKVPADVYEKSLPVKIDGNGTVSELALATDFPVGVVELTAKAGVTRLAVRTGFTCTLKASVTGATTKPVAGEFASIKAITNGAAFYTKSVTGNYTNAIVLEASGDDVLLGIFPTPFKV
jgi:hypothetical protein